MELKELKTIWQQYDLKLNNLEGLNKKIIMETLSKKPKSKLNRIRFRSIHVLILVLIVVIVFFQPYFKIDNINWQFIIGWGLTLSVVFYLTYINLKSFMTLKEINIGDDPIIESAKKVNNYRRIINIKQKYVWISNHLLFAGVLLIAWNAFTFDTKTVLFMAGLFVFAFALGIIQLKNQRGKIEKLEKGILDLEDYEK